MRDPDNFDEAPKFDKPLDEWIDEEVPVLKHHYDPKSKRITSVTELEKVKTMYINAPKIKHRCKDGEHVFDVIDTHKYIFQCRNCRYSRQVYPTTYKYDKESGALTHWITGKRV